MGCRGGALVNVARSARAVLLALATTTIVLAGGASTARALDEAADSTATEAPAAPKSNKPSRFYYGGNVSMAFYGDVWYAIVQPLVGYNFTPKLSSGGKLTYEYVKDRRPNPDQSSHNYGGSVFTRYRFIPEAFAQAEFELLSYDRFDGRTTVPFLFLGGGYARPIAPRTWMVVEVLFDVIQSDKSPYERGEPRVAAGIHVGF